MDSMEGLTIISVSRFILRNSRLACEALREGALFRIILFSSVEKFRLIQRHALLLQGGIELSLTRKELGLLEYLMLHQERPVSQEELIQHVWDGSVDSFSNSIRVHISALRKKLRAALGYDPITNRIGQGYLIGGMSE